MTPQTITVNDAWQEGYTYQRTEPVGENFDPEFTPDLAPREMLALGVFGGKYFWDKPEEFPENWWVEAQLSPDGTPQKNMNCFEIDASQPIEIWREKGWIHEDDPRGWFQWYARYYMGRRHEDDVRQIKRWKAMKRHVAQLTKACQTGDFDCRRRQRQALLHWAYDSRKM